MKILSFDCAYKSLAYICYEVITNNLQKNGAVYCVADLKINIFSCDVVDVLDGKTPKNLTKLEKVSALKNFLTTTFADIDANTIIVIERQPNKISFSGVNLDNIAIEDSIIYHFSNRHKIIMADPKAKNNICFNAELTFANILSKVEAKSKSKDASRKKYTARKNHTKENFYYYLTQHNLLDNIAHIKKAYYDDIADAFMNSLIAFV